MKRIDSVNARPDVNGTGKKGFHDNADLPGQDATYITPSFMNTVQEELANAVEMSGLNLDPNDPAQLFKLFNLHNKALVQRIYHVGSKHMTDNADWNPAVELQTYFGYQTSWMLWPYVPVGVEGFADPIGQISALSGGNTVQGKLTRIWQRLPDGESAPTYTLTANKSAVNEGEQVTFTLATTGLKAGTLVDWAITGVQEADITPSALSGKFTIGADGKAAYTLTAVADQKTEGNETLKFALSYIPNKAVNVLVMDTSKYPEGLQTYYEGSHVIEVQPNQTIILDMYGAGGGGGGSVYTPAENPRDGTDGGNIVLTYLANTLIAGGGKKGIGGAWGNGSHFFNGEGGLGGTNTITADSSFDILANQNGNAAVIVQRWETQKGATGLTSSIGTINSGGDGATGIGDERWAYGGGGGSGGRLKVKYTNTIEEVVTFNLIVGAKGQGWKSGGNSGTDGGIGFAIVSTS
jgi:hypothetical protein